MADNCLPPKHPTPKRRDRGAKREVVIEWDYNYRCILCGNKPVAKGFGLCGPCLTGVAETAEG